MASKKKEKGNWVSRLKGKVKKYFKDAKAAKKARNRKVGEGILRVGHYNKKKRSNSGKKKGKR